MSLVKAYIGLGSNLQKPIEQVRSALFELAEHSEINLLCASSLYRSAPMGPQDQPDYINAVAAVETGLVAHDLLHVLQQIELGHQRVRERHWGPRTLDLDLLLYGNERINSETLVVPHVGIKERNFVLLPLYEIAPELRLPDNQPLAELVASCDQQGLERLEKEV